MDVRSHIGLLHVVKLTEVEKLTEEMRAKSCTQIFGMEDDWAPASFLQKMEDGRMEDNSVGLLTYMEW